MTVKLELNPEVEAGLLAQAEARGLSLEDYLQQVLRERSAAPVPTKGTTGNAAKAREFLAFARSQRHTPPLSDEAVSRQNMIRDGQ